MNNQEKKPSLLKKPVSFQDSINPDRIFLLLLTKTRKKFLIRTSIFFTKLGNGQLWFLFTIIISIYSIPIGVAFQAAIFFQLYIQIVCKNLVKRSRPYKKYIDLEALYNPPDPYSFPSGHTCAAFTMYFVSYSVFPAFYSIFFIIAVLIAFSRVYLAVHYPSDIFGGIIVAYFSAKWGIMFSSLVTGIVL